MAETYPDLTASPSPEFAGEHLPPVEATSADQLCPTEGVTNMQLPLTEGVTMDQTQNANKGTMAETLPSCWKSPLRSNTELIDFLERAKKHVRLITKGFLHLDPKYEEEFSKRTVCVFVVDKRNRKICRSTKDNVSKALISLGYTPQQIVRGVGAFMWDVLLPTAEDAMKI